MIIKKKLMLQKKIIYYFVLLSILFLSYNFLNSQLVWEHTYGDGLNHEIGYCLTKALDGGYIVVGKKEPIGGDESEVYLVRLNDSGDTIWTRTYGDTSYCAGASITTTQDSGFIIVGYTSVPEGLLILKYDKYGDIIYANNYGTDYTAAGRTIIKTTDGGYLVLGSISLGGIYVLKLDPYGDTLWTRKYAFSANISRGYAVTQTDDGGYLIVGSKQPVGPETPRYLLIFKISEDGDTLWSRDYYLLEYSSGNSVINRSDGGFIILGQTYSYWPEISQLFLFKIDGFGFYEWSYFFGDSIYLFYSGVIAPCNDSGYIIISTKSPWIIEENSRIWLQKYNKNDDLQWEREFNRIFGTIGNYILQTDDRGYILTGYTIDDIRNADLYVVKTDSIGSTNIDEDISYLYGNTPLLAYPNPFNNSITINTSDNCVIEIFDICGRIVTSVSTVRNNILFPNDDRIEYVWRPIPSVGSGVYFIKAQKDEGVIGTIKIIYLK